MDSFSQMLTDMGRWIDGEAPASATARTTITHPVTDLEFSHIVGGYQRLVHRVEIESEWNSMKIVSEKSDAPDKVNSEPVKAG